MVMQRASLNTCTGDTTEMADTWVNKGADGRLGSLGKRERWNLKETKSIN